MIALVNRTIGTSRKLICVSRPRRFGKSFAAQMLCAYYDRPCDSRALFEGLSISDDPTFEAHLNKYYAIYLDMTGIKPYTNGFCDVDDAYKRYFDESGIIQTGWRTIGGKSYYFRASGAMQTGDATIDGISYRFSDKGVLLYPDAPKRELTLNYDDVTIHSNDHGRLAIWINEALHIGDTMEALTNVNFYYSHAPAIQLKAYLNGKQVSAEDITWSRKYNYGYGYVDEQGVVSGSPNSGFVTMGKGGSTRSQTITAALKSDPSVSKSINITFVYDAKVSFSSSNSSVATVDSAGNIRGVSEGVATVTMTSAITGRSASCEVTVKPRPIEVEQILVSTPSPFVPLSKTVELSAEVLPISSTDKAIRWESSNPNVASVDGSGKVTGISGGCATITATASNGTIGSKVVRVTGLKVLECLAYLTGPDDTTASSYTIIDTSSWQANPIYPKYTPISLRGLNAMVYCDVELFQGAVFKFTFRRKDTSYNYAVRSVEVSDGINASHMGWGSASNYAIPVEVLFAGLSGDFDLYYEILLPNGQILYSSLAKGDEPMHIHIGI